MMTTKGFASLSSSVLYLDSVLVGSAQPFLKDLYQLLQIFKNLSENIPTADRSLINSCQLTLPSSVFNAGIFA